MEQSKKDATNSNVVYFVIPGNPIPLKRPRFSNGKVYDSQKQEKLLVGLILQRQIRLRQGYAGQGKSNPTLTGCIYMDITFYFPISRAVSNIKKQKMILAPHFSRPDISNCIKFYEDVLQENGIFRDDAQIGVIFAKKLYDTTPRTEITLREIYHETSYSGKEPDATKKSTQKD